MWAYFSSLGRDPYLFYGGESPVSKPNVRLMIEALGIPVHYDPGLASWDGLLITVDGQYGGNNMQRVEVAEVAVIDHHPPSVPVPVLAVIKPQIGSCATLVWSMLQEEGFVVDETRRALSIALFYGLHTDTNGFSEARHPLDLNMRDALTFQDSQRLMQEEPVLREFFTSTLSLDDLAVAFDALHKIYVNEESGYALAEAEPCDPNLLGYISDLAIQVAGIYTMVAFTPYGGGFKFSVLTSGREARARDVTAWLVSAGYGNGGGHKDKAGGWIAETVLDMNGGQSAYTFFRTMMDDYCTRYTVINAPPSPDMLRPMRFYRKKETVLGYVPALTLFSPGSRVHLRMLEGEMTITANADTFFMIGIRGEAYFMDKKAFMAQYAPLEKPFMPSVPFEFSPTATPASSGDHVALLPHAKSCRTKPAASPVLAMRLETPVKIFPRWDKENYLAGEIGDWLLARQDDPEDVYVVKDEIFSELYEPFAAVGRDYSGEEVRSLPGSVRVAKKRIPVAVEFAQGSGKLATREGAVSFEKGDALLTGTFGERWPMQRARFVAAYRPAGGSGALYEKVKSKAWAVQPGEPFMVRLERGVLSGNGGTGFFSMKMENTAS